MRSFLDPILGAVLGAKGIAHRCKDLRSGEVFDLAVTKPLPAMLDVVTHLSVVLLTRK